VAIVRATLKYYCDVIIARGRLVSRAGGSTARTFIQHNHQTSSPLLTIRAIFGITPDVLMLRFTHPLQLLANGQIWNKVFGIAILCIVEL